MSERGVGKPWTTYEDKLLIQAVAVHGENDNWKAVAASIPGRTNKACRKRWLHSLSPNVKKTAWTPEEDQLLLSLFATHGTKWSVIARSIPGRTDDACSKRYREALDPSLKRDDWTADEDAQLMEAYSRQGGKWGLIGQELNRSGLGCRNRWRMLERRKASHSRDAALRAEPSSTVPGPSSSSSQWSPAHVQDTPIWDGRSPQYVTPSALYQGSPLHSQESHGTSYSPAQILSGAHLSGPSSTAQDQQTYQHASSPLSDQLSQPGPVTHASDAPHYRNSASLTVGREHSQTPGFDVSSEQSRTRTYDSTSYEFMSINQGARSPTPETYQHGGGHTVDDIVSPHPYSQTVSSLDPVIDPDPGVPPYSPASPSQVGSPSPSGSPAPTPGNQTSDLLVVAAGPTTAPKSYYRTQTEKAEARKALAQRKPTSPQCPTRLSSMLPATQDANVLAYACGHRDCWPEDASSSKRAFVTSKELSHHSKTDHNSDLGGSKPFRCGLTGCEKSWKSVNGLQYHLQISRYHFQQALATPRTDIPVGGTASPDKSSDNSQAQAQVPPPQPTVARATSSDEEAMVESGTAPTSEDPQRKPGPDKMKRKTHPCPHAGCDKRYKQLSGLRYHLTHGHVDVLPLQLDAVPPTLARILAEKEKVARE